MEIGEKESGFGRRERNKFEANGMGGGEAEVSESFALEKSPIIWERGGG